MKPITIFSGATGLNTVDDPVRLPFQENGMTDLQVAINISIDQSLRVNRREGVTELQSGSFHSLYSKGNGCFVIKDDSLYQVAVDGSLTGIRSDLTLNKRMDFERAGPRFYYCNGFERGFIKDGVSNVWNIGTYIGPDTNRHFSGPMSGNHLSVFGSRLFIAEGKVLWWSEPYNYSLYNKAESFAQFNSEILMVKPVAGGIFVSTKNRVVFLGGTNPLEFTMQDVTNYPAVEWSDAIELVSASELGFKSSGLCALWASPEGAILGFPSGDTFNLNKEKIIYPENAKEGFGCLKGYNFIHGVN